MAGAWKLTLRNFGIIVLKDAVNAILTNAALMLLLQNQFNNVSSVQGWWNIGKVTFAVVGGKEASVWIPKLLAWSQTPSTELQDRLGKAQEATKVAVVATQVAENAVTEAKSIAPPKP